MNVKLPLHRTIFRSALRVKYLVFLLVLISFFSCNKQTSVIDLVDPNIGTAHSRWFFYTPGALPFGMAKPGPTTDAHYGNLSGWQAVGYDERHSSIESFVSFREFQVGGLAIMPINGELITVPGDTANPDLGYRSRINRETEIAWPGYYSVILEDYKIKAELTSTNRVAYHRFSFPENESSYILFDVGRKQGESGEVLDAKISRLDDGSLEGYVITEPVYVNRYQNGATVKLFFSAVLDAEYEEFGGFNGVDIFAGDKQAEGKGCGFFVKLNTDKPKDVELQVGLSYTSVENARDNRLYEAAGLNFDGAHKNASSVWEEMLGRIIVEGGKTEDQVKFYTGLYHALLGRGLASDVNGAYPQNDGSIGQIPLDENGNPIHHHYNTDAFWGSFWNLMQLWGLVYPEMYAELVNSQLLVYENSGWLGDGIAASRYVSGVGTNFVGLLIANAYNLGIRNFDIPLGYEAALKNELDGNDRVEGAGKMDTKAFVEKGYSPFTDGGFQTDTAGSHFSASHTMEYSFSAYAVAQMARQLGKDEDYKKLMELSNGWKKLYNEDWGLVVPRDSEGNFISNFDPKQVWRGFQEGNAWQYTFYVPHNIEGLKELIGQEKFVNVLDSIFTVSETQSFGGGNTLDAFAGINFLYNHGNQPSLHISWLFNYTDSPWLSQKWVRSICDTFYGTGGIHGYGYGQDEDQGQLGAWYVMAAMGFFDISGGTAETPAFSLTGPLFDKISIQLNQDYYQGEKIEIFIQRSDADDVYIQDLSLNGQEYYENSILQQELTKGGEIHITLGPEPNKDWGMKK